MHRTRTASPPGALAALALLALLGAGCKESEDTILTDTGTDPDTTVDPAGDGTLDTRADPDAPPDGTGDAPADARTDRDASSDAPAEEARTCRCLAPPTTCTTPERIAFSRWDDDMQTQVLQAIACATTTLDIAMYDVQWSCLIDAILAAKAAHPSLEVKVIVENENCGPTAALTCDAKRIVTAGAGEVHADTRLSYLMHHKTILVDAGLTGAMAVIGSANWTYKSFCEDYNDSLLVTDDTIVGALLAEFDRMWGGAFGDTPWTEPVSGGGADLFFSPPGNDWQGAIVARLGLLGSGATVRFLVSAFTLQEMADALKAAKARGADVKGVVGRRFAGEAAVASMLTAGIEVKKAEVHHKALFLDDGTSKAVFMGSGNWSAAARDNNNETVLYFADDAALHDAFAAEFTGVFSAASSI